MKLKLLLCFNLCFCIVIGNAQSSHTYNVTTAIGSSGSPCFSNTAFTYNSTVSGRNIYQATVGGFSYQLKYSGTRWEMICLCFPNQVYYITSSTITPNPPTTGWSDGADNGGFCGALTIGLTVMPVELTAFDVQNTEGSKNHLTWRTASEKDNSHFDIERSTDGSTFHNIGQVKGNNKPSSYQYVDAAPFTMSYYRLKQVDFDGTTTYSKVVSVEQKGKGKGLKVYPTLVSNGILTVDTEGGDYSIYNIVGQQVQSGQTTQRLDVSALAKGTYILKVGAEQVKFVKQ